MKKKERKISDNEDLDDKDIESILKEELMKKDNRIRKCGIIKTYPDCVVY